MSHEIRTPLNGIIGMTELAMCSTGAEQHEYHKLIKSSGEALLVILNDILDYSKIEAGKIVIEEIPFNLEEVVSGSIKSIANSAHKKGIEITFQIDADVPVMVAGDPNRLRQVLLNLTGNAIKFTQKGNVSIHVAVNRVNSAKTSLQFSVQDSGIGISPEQQSKLFQPFQQADSSTTRRYGGTGLGLAISGRIVELMGGRIWIESTPQKGSTFHFTIPFALTAESFERPARVVSGDFSGKRVLIIDDNQGCRDVLQAMTASWQMESEAVDSAAAGIICFNRAVAANRPFHLILLDEQVSDLGEVEFMNRVRTGAPASTALILLLSSTDRRSGDRAGYHYGANNPPVCVIKPVGLSELYSAVQEAFGKRDVDLPLSVTLPERNVPQNQLEILVAEDNPVNQKLAVAMFEKMGHRVTLADNGHEAVKKWTGGQFDLIFMDVQMPMMDGLEATRQIRVREKQGKRIPIIAMTANVMSGDRELCLSSGMDDYVSKPISRKTLVDALERTAVCSGLERRG